MARLSCSIIPIVSALVGFLPKVIVVLFGYQCENRPAHRNPWFTLVSGFFPRFFVQPDLLSLLYMERFTAFVELQGRTLQVHSVFGRPNSCSIRSGSPPDTFPQSFRSMAPNAASPADSETSGTD